MQPTGIEKGYCVVSKSTNKMRDFYHVTTIYHFKHCSNFFFKKTEKCRLCPNERLRTINGQYDVEEKCKINPGFNNISGLEGGIAKNSS